MEGKNENIYMSSETRTRLYKLMQTQRKPNKSELVARGLELVEEEEGQKGDRR